jgi:hypothetical protein
MYSGQSANNNQQYLQFVSASVIQFNYLTCQVGVAHNVALMSRLSTHSTFYVTSGLYVCVYIYLSFILFTLQK